MPELHRPLRVITYNLKGNPHERERELADLGAISKLGPQVVGLQECKEWDRAHRRQRRAAESILGMRSVMLPSNSDDCHLALLVDDSVVEILEDRHRTEGFHHGVLCVRTLIHGHVIDLAVAHLAPASPAKREIEAETFALFTGPGHDLIAMGDWNAAPLEEADLPIPATVNPGKARRKLDTRAAVALAEAGLADVGAHLGDRTPTVGHTGPDTLAYRCDRILTTLPPATFVQHQVHTLGGSDHHPVEAVFDLGRTGAPHATAPGDAR